MRKTSVNSFVSVLAGALPAGPSLAGPLLAGASLAGPVLAGVMLASVLPGRAQAEPQSEERTVGAFSKLRAERGVDVVLTQSDRESLTIEVDGYELDDVRSEVEGDELVLSRVEGSDRFFGDGRITARVGFVQLSGIDASAGADVRSANELHLDEAVIEASAGSDVDLDVQAQTSLEFDLSAGSDLELTGKAPSLSIEASAGSDVDATSFEAERVSVRLSSGSDARVRATQAIEIDASGGSDVVVSGNPAQRVSNADRSSDVVWR